jgi:uncharacterized protein
MIPLFPKFKHLELVDKEDIENITKKHPPYSDFNFVSLWSWNIEQKFMISKLNGNLIVQFQDYLTKKTFNSFIGIENLVHTIENLLLHAKNEKIHSALKLVPEKIVELLPYNHGFEVIEDKDNYDYILSVSDLVGMKGNKFHKKRNMVTRFIKDHKNEVQTKILDISDPVVQRQMTDLFLQWEKVRGRKRADTENELIAIKNLYKGAHKFNLQVLGLYLKNKFVGFSVEELIHDKHAMIHFEKADTTYIGIFEYLKHQSVIHLHNKGCEYINYEQDLGIEGLRISKQSYRPIKYLKKYTILKK